MRDHESQSVCEPVNSWLAGWSVGRGGRWLSGDEWNQEYRRQEDEEEEKKVDEEKKKEEESLNAVF